MSGTNVWLPLIPLREVEDQKELFFVFAGRGGGGAVVATAQAIPTVNSQCFKAPLGN